MHTDVPNFLSKGVETRAGELAGIGGSFPMHVDILKVLPSILTVISAEPFGKSDFSATGRIRTKTASGNPKDYFVKCAVGEEGAMMLNGECKSLEAIAEVIKGLVPVVHGSGAFHLHGVQSKIHFMVEDFLNLKDTLPDPRSFASVLVQMHRQSRSPTGKFGFDVTTCDGPLPHPVEWEQDWAIFFAKLLRTRVDMDAAACGPWPELERVADHVISKVVPRLLRSLSSDGNPIKPTLIHGDLWDTNVGTDGETGSPVIFDAGSYYAHNEMETGIWRVIYAQKLGTKAYRDAYLELYPPAEPSGEWDDRNRLYSLKCNLNWSATDPGIRTRNIAFNDMCYLCEKYAPLADIAKYDPSLDPTITKIDP
ncbi:Fructosamine kinase-domain-containing protein [Ampelomyces quisqualis]|uniref:protein-ribulosamine 3-kinase n=1 Tax=Ampelomyces quisqualis TaxID=50730 RepID=A0A6A5QGC7_AMPQU|nr:Fructosamine kinase-domain-containing protein [Ampelomyces quisqualis]